MRLTTSVIAGFIAVGAATPAGLTILSTSTSGSADAVTARSTPVDGNWHIGCDANNYCSYYQDSDIAAESSADSLSSRTIALSEATCKQCTSQDPCDYCDHSKFSCRDCDHYQCEDGYLRYQTHCFDIQPELAEAIRNHTGVTDIPGVTATIYETVTSTSVETSSIVLPTPTFDSTITITTPRDEVASNDVGSQQHVRRNAAFKQSQCMPCDALTCPRPQPSTVTVEKPASTIVYHYQDPASTVVVQPPTVTASRSPSVIEIPMTMITTATHTVARSVRAVHTPAPMSSRDIAMAKTTCNTCDGNTECDGCDFACDEDCFYFLCKDAVGGSEVCVSVPEDAKAFKANDASMTPSDFLGSAAMLLVLDDAEDSTSNASASHLQPAVSNGTRPNFAFAEEDCYLCEVGDESCGMCDWQFTCGTKKRCFHNGAREVVEMCFETGEKCRP
ncbi:unnamed protein product [Alternaria alternata]